jgi:hypothetical protein
MRHAAILAAILAFVPLASATAQVPIRPGARVRVTGHFCQFYSNCAGGYPQHRVGSFVAWKADTLVVQSNGDTLSVPVDDLVTGLDVSRGWKRHTGEGFGYGLVLGLVAGGFVGALAYEPPPPPPPPPCDGDGWSCAFGSGFGLDIDLGWVPRMFIGAGIGAGIGAVAGALVGFAIKTEQWEEAPLDRIRVSFAPQRDGRWGLGASVRF